MTTVNPHLFDSNAHKVPDHERIKTAEQAVNECRQLIDACAVRRRQIDLMSSNPKSFGVTVQDCKRMGWQLLVEVGGILGRVKAYYQCGIFGQQALDALCSEAERSIAVSLVEP